MDATLTLLLETDFNNVTHEAHVWDGVATYLARGECELGQEVVLYEEGESLRIRGVCCAVFDNGRGRLVRIRATSDFWHEPPSGESSP